MKGVNIVTRVKPAQKGNETDSHPSKAEAGADAEPRRRPAVDGAHAMAGDSRMKRMNTPEELSPPPTDDPRIDKSMEDAAVRRVAHWLVLIGGATLGGAFVVGGAVSMLINPSVFQIALKHFAATVGLPAAALAALCLVVFLESSSGPIEFKGLGFKFKGASGPIVLWVLCFLAIAGAIQLLWTAGS
jgi:hypothetical protein